MPAQYNTTKQSGAHYTPLELANFVAERALLYFKNSGQFSVLDPAMGDGALLDAIAFALNREGRLRDCVLHGFDTNPETLSQVSVRMERAKGPNSLDLRNQDFLEHALNNASAGDELSLFEEVRYDLVIANPPYVRTQVMGSERSKELAEAFDLDGRVDLSSAFLVAIGRVLSDGGIASIIVSNRFMKTSAGASVRRYLSEHFDILEVWDFGDTRLFEAAVLPVVLVLRKKTSKSVPFKTAFTTIYSTIGTSNPIAVSSVFEAVHREGEYRINEAQQYKVTRGLLDTSQDVGKPWRLSNSSQDSWLNQVHRHTFARFGDVGKIRVGVKTTADSVFIKSGWRNQPEAMVPELVRPLITHVGAQRWRMKEEHFSRILYTHAIINGKRRAVDLSEFPISKAYLESHREVLSGRKYVEKAGRQWYEIWVPQDPDLWKKPKIVFRDICEAPTFWMDRSGAVVNGDCYWITADGAADDTLLWLALAIANSKFIEGYYDHSFNNKLYAGRRRFMTQYVEEFPICDPDCSAAKELVAIAKRMYGAVHEETGLEAERRENLIRDAFGIAAL